MKILIEFQAKRDRISDFFEKELTEDSWCLFTVGSDLETVLMNMLADEFECWYSFDEEADFNWWDGNKYKRIENDIEAWFYNSMSDNEPKTITINNKVYPVDSLEEFYEFLVNQYKSKKSI